MCVNPWLMCVCVNGARSNCCYGIASGWQHVANKHGVSPRKKLGRMSFERKPNHCLHVQKLSKVVSISKQLKLIVLLY